MQFLREIDRFTLGFITLSVIGLIIGLLGLKNSKSFYEANSSREKIASIVVTQKDTRLKRAGTIEWFSLTSNADCFEDDKIFTGPDSTVTITYLSGTQITLLPNSLITLSKGYVALSSGSIEVNVKKGSFALEAFGEKIPLEQTEKVRITQDGSKRSIVPLGASVKSLEQPHFVSLIKSPSLQLTAPESGDSFARFPGTRLFFSWKLTSALPEQNFRVEVSPDAEFTQQVFSRELLKNSIQVPAEILPSGILHWRVTELSTKQSATGTFVLDPQIEILSKEPLPDSSYSLSENNPEAYRFDWSARLPLPQRLQVSRDQNFSNTLIDSVGVPPVQALPRDLRGIFFWRVGYVVSNKLTHWSAPSKFELKDLAPPVPLLLSSLPLPLDFSLNPEYVLNIRDRNNCKNFELVIVNEASEILRISSDKPQFKILPLKDGNYSLEVRGLLPDERKVVSKKVFRVKNSPPVPAPVIKNKKNVKLLVQLIQTVFEAILPSAHAQESFYTLKWEGIENASYELEISRPDKSILIKEFTTETSYKFLVPGPEKYIWRVRTKLGNRWSEFSEYSEIEIFDKVIMMKEPLMISPANAQELIIESDVKDFPLTWKEVPGYEYYLEIFGSAKSKKPSFSIQLKKNEYTLQFKRIPRRFFWRVTAVSSYGNKSPAPKLNAVIITRKPEVPLRYQLQPALLFSTTDFTQDFDGTADIQETASFAGPALNVSGEYFLKRYNNHRSFAFEARYGSFTSGGDELTDTRLLLEYGWLSDPFGKETHNFHLGYLFHNIDFSFGENLSAAYGLNFISGKYSWIKIWSKRSLLELTGSLLIAVPPKEYVPSFLIKPVYHQRLNQDWWLIVLGMFERYSASGEAEVGSEKQDLSLSVQNISVGVGISYRPE